MTRGISRRLQRETKDEFSCRPCYNVMKRTVGSAYVYLVELLNICLHMLQKRLVPALSSGNKVSCWLFLGGQLLHKHRLNSLTFE